jgi:magnesium transporter
MRVSCVVYKDGKRLSQCATEQIGEFVRRSDCFVWVALLDADADELAQMQAQFDLHPLAVEDAHHGHQRPKIEEYGDSLFVVLKMVEQIGEELRVGEVDIFAGPNYVLSVRSGVEKGFHDVRQRAEREPELLRHGTGYVLYALMDAVVDRYFPVIDEFESELERIEERIFAEGSSARASIEALYSLKQRLMTLKHAVAPTIEAVSKLFSGRVPPIAHNMQDYYRDVYDHLVRLNQTLDSLRDMVVTAISVNLSMITLQESETVKRLAAYAALVAVPTMIAGIYGMNFQHMPELTSTFGYPIVLGVMAGIDVYLFRRFRKARWL